jgi:hypothetical protein
MTFVLLYFTTFLDLFFSYLSRPVFLHSYLYLLPPILPLPLSLSIFTIAGDFLKNRQGGLVYLGWDCHDVIVGTFPGRPSSYI